jgi:tripartite-type tricarboxylate transporter receptor subunit TctC
MMLSLVGGQCLFVFGDTPTVIPLAQSGRLRALAVANASRIAELPGVPTLAEAGLGDLDVKPQWNGVFAVTGTPPAIVRKLENALKTVSEDKTVRERTRALFYSPESAGSDAFRARIDSDIKAFSDVVKAANLKFEQ